MWYIGVVICAFISLAVGFAMTLSMDKHIEQQEALKK